MGNSILHINTKYNFTTILSLYLYKNVAYHFVLVEYLNNDGGWLVFNFFLRTIDQDLVKDQQLVPSGTKGLVNHLENIKIK